MKHPVVFLMGPTAAGKTELATTLVDRFPFEIISVDSALVYRGLDIGTAKPTPHILARYPHHLIDIRDPHENYSAAEFRNDALAAIAAVHARNNVPLLVGGTGLYFRTLEQGIAELPPVSPRIRERLNTELRALGSAAMHRKLQTVDPARAAKIHPNDPQRTLRALEIFESSGRTMSDWLATQIRDALPFPIIKWVLAPNDRADLHERIEQRFRQMLNEGLINEVRRLRADPRLDLARPAMRAVGYRAVWEFLEGEFNFEAMQRAATVATRQLAKRQYTWFRAEQAAEWFDAADGQLVRRVERSLNQHTLFQ